MARLREIVMFFVVTVVFGTFLKRLIYMGYFGQFLNHSPGPCKVMKVNGSEDIAILSDGLAIISSGLHPQVGSVLDPQLHQRVGKLLLFNMDKPDKDPLGLTLKQFNRTGFNPHGISVYQDPISGATSLFVVNHRPDTEAIEIFDFEGKSHSLVHRRTVVDKLIHNPNNLQADGPDSFYVTNDNYFYVNNSLPHLLSSFVFPGWLHTDIIYYNGSKAIVAAASLPFQNGIAMDTQGRFVYVGIGSTVNIFRRQKDQTLTFSQAINVGSYVDNINVDPVKGDLWLAGIPKVLDAMAHMSDLSLRCPTQVVAIHLGQPSTSGIAFPDHTIREVYMNDGTELSLGTVVAVHKDRMLVGSLFSNLLYCEVKHY